MSIVFDRAVHFYDQTRAVPPQILDLAFDALIRETGITRESHVLEIGVGTGRIALPLSERIGHVFGVDLSFGMMSVLQNKMPTTHGNVLLAQADALHLPFPAGSFDLIYAVHVLHLIMGWQAAVTEAWRALRPGGFFVANYHRRGPDMPNVVLRKELHKLVEPYGVSTKRPGAQSEEEIYAELEKWDPNLRVVDVTDWTEPDTPSNVLWEIENQIHSETWSIPRDVLDQVMPQLRAWAIANYGNLNQPYDAAYSFRWLIAQKK